MFLCRGVFWRSGSGTVAAVTEAQVAHPHPRGRGQGDPSTRDNDKMATLPGERSNGIADLTRTLCQPQNQPNDALSVHPGWDAASGPGPPASIFL